MAFSKDVKTETVSLNEIQPGEKCRIRSIQLIGAEGQRLLDMGFIRGAAVEVIRNAPFADPLEVSLDGAKISLRHHEAKLLTVEKQ